MFHKHHRTHWGFIRSINMTIESGHKLPTPLRINDKSIMDKLIKSEKYNMEELLQANACRLYLQVLSLADICEGDDTGFWIIALKGYKTKQELANGNGLIYHAH